MSGAAMSLSAFLKAAVFVLLCFEGFAMYGDDEVTEKVASASGKAGRNLLNSTTAVAVPTAIAITSVPVPTAIAITSVPGLTPFAPGSSSSVNSGVAGSSSTSNAAVMTMAATSLRSPPPSIKCSGQCCSYGTAVRCCQYKTVWGIKYCPKWACSFVCASTGGIIGCLAYC
eukprot:jgi/Botrbrau1/3541/Bobra.341_2s0067.1